MGRAAGWLINPEDIDMNQEQMMKQRIPYGIMNYAEMVEKNGYFVDKTRFIQRLEDVQNPVFLRPRRFGKSLFCSMLRYYYDLREADRFDELFGHTWIGAHPTGNQNRYIVLSLDFSEIAMSEDLSEVEYHFRRYCNESLIRMTRSYPDLADIMPDINPDDDASMNLSIWLNRLYVSRMLKVFVIIDEYDNFVNHLITSHRDHLYQRITTEESFLRTYYKVLKAGRQTGSVANIFITGVLPITIDDLSSAYNISTFITLDPAFEQMLGFTQDEVETLLDEIYTGYQIDPSNRHQVTDVIRTMYNGYHFVNPDAAAVYNPTMLMFFLRQFSELQAIPDTLFDMNLRTDLEWIRRLTGGRLENLKGLITQLTTDETIPYNRKILVSQFSMSEFFKPAFYPVSLFYLGILTKHDEFALRIPNISMKEIAVEYFNELFEIDIGTEQYEVMMREFVASPDLSRLFADYWRYYIGQIPEAAFSQVNENFYRTTFFELCSRYLSPWFTWNIERSYPQGRTDLEFVGKYHEQFAGLRWVIEFKYFSNTQWERLKTSIDDFVLQEKDTMQVSGYAEGLSQEYPEADIRLFVIYCIGNRGFRVFEVERQMRGL